MPDVPFHPYLFLRNPKQQPIKQNIQEINPNINFDYGRKITISGRHHFKDIQKTGQVILSKSKRVRRPYKQRKFVS